jgi:hypothetical protein
MDRKAVNGMWLQRLIGYVMVMFVRRLDLDSVKGFFR